MLSGRKGFKAMAAFCAVMVPLINAQSIEDAVGFAFSQEGIGSNGYVNSYSVASVQSGYIASFWNPAGLSGETNSHFYLQSDYQGHNNHIITQTSSHRDNERFLGLPALGVVFRMPTERGSLVFATGYHSVKSLNSFSMFSGMNTIGTNLGWYEGDDTYSNAGVFQTQSLKTAGRLGALHFTGAMQIARNLHLGGSVKYLYGYEDYRFQYYHEDVNNIYTEYPDDFQSYQLINDINTILTGWHISIGAIYDIGDFISIGAKIDVPFALNVKEEWSYWDELIFDDEYIETISDAGEWEYAIKYPEYYELGAVYKGEVLEISGSLGYRAWEETKFAIPGDQFWGEGSADLLSENLRWSETSGSFDGKLGGAFRLNDEGLKVRMGLRLATSPFKADKWENDRKYIGVGTEIPFWEKQMFFASYTYGWWKNTYRSDFISGSYSDEQRHHHIQLGMKITFEAY
jgi:hypothetical protein